MEEAKRKICVYFGKRGGFGAYLPLMRLIESDPRLELQIILGDMHVSKKFGSTVKEVKSFFPKAKIALVEMGTGRGDSPLVRAENLGVCLKKVAQIMGKLKPDIFLIHGDRGDHFIAAFAALNLGIPIAHTQGGEISGNIDDIQRHALTKIAHLHFTETKMAAERIRKMGEDDWRIKTVGSVYIDRIVKKIYSPFNETRGKYGLLPGEKYFIIIFHPDTFESKDNNYRHMKNTLRAVKSFGLRSFVIFPCSDSGYGGVVKAIKEAGRDPYFLIYKNIHNFDFLSLMENAQALIGNSSCALVEAPYFKLPAVNIGNRQIGRYRQKNVIDARPTISDVKEKINHILTNQKYKKQLLKMPHRLGEGDAARKIIKILRSIPLNNKLLRKRLAY